MLSEGRWQPTLSSAARFGALLVLFVRLAFTFLAGLVLSIGVALDGNDVGVVRKAVDKRRCGRGVWKDCPPAPKRQIRCKYDGFDLVTAVDQLEKYVCGGIVVCQVSKFINPTVMAGRNARRVAASALSAASSTYN